MGVFNFQFSSFSRCPTSLKHRVEKNTFDDYNVRSFVRMAKQVRPREKQGKASTERLKNENERRYYVILRAIEQTTKALDKSLKTS